MSEYELTESDHIDVSAKAIEILASNHSDGFHELFEHIAQGHGETFLRFIAIMCSYRIADQDMSDNDYESHKIGCLHGFQKLEEELRPMLKDIIDEIVNEIQHENKAA